MYIDRHGLADAAVTGSPRENIITDYQRFIDLITSIKKAWEEFQSTGEVSVEGVVREEVLQSWRRCKSVGLDPYAPVLFQISKDEISERIEHNRVLISVATPFLQTLVDSVKGSGFRVDLYDRELYLLAQFGEDEALKEAAAHGTLLGVNRSEIYSGTNAINLAAHLQRPIQLVGPEHYAATLHYWTCSATPIFNPEGEFIGVINMAGNYLLMHKHTLGMVIAVGKVVEQSLQQRRLIHALEESNEYLNSVIQAVTDGLLVVDPDGKVTTLNQSAAHFLGVNQKAALGMDVDELLGVNNPFKEVLVSGKPIVNSELALGTRGKRNVFVGSIEPVRGKRGIHGVIGILKHFDDARRFVKDVAGFRAHFSFADLVGEEPEFKKCISLARQAAKLQVTVLLQGETGTGKELFAQAIHNESAFRNGPFVAVNCAAIPRELIESELFGYEEGAFTGAQKGGRPGKFELAEGGSIFLDEVNSMSLDMQAKLLRVLQTKCVVRVGGISERPINVRIICATNRDLGELVKKGAFREDLFYRIHVLPIKIPPLRARPKDIGLLAIYFKNKLQHQLGADLQITEDALRMMMEYSWPGNVRELENVLERCAIVALSRGVSSIDLDDITVSLGLRSCANVGTNHAGPQPDTLSTVELNAVVNALRLSGGNISEAARVLGVARTTLYRKIKRYGLEEML